MTDKTSLGDHLPNPVGNYPGRHPDHFVPPGESVLVVEGLKVIEVGIADGKGKIPVEVALHLLQDRLVPRKAGQRVGVKGPTDPGEGQGNPHPDLTFLAGLYQYIVDLYLAPVNPGWIVPFGKDQEERKVPENIFLFEFPANPIASETGKVPSNENQVGRFRIDEIKGLASFVGGIGSVPRPLQHMLKCRDRFRILIHNEDTSCRTLFHGTAFFGIRLRKKTRRGSPCFLPAPTAPSR